MNFDPRYYVNKTYARKRTLQLHANPILLKIRREVMSKYISQVMYVSPSSNSPSGMGMSEQRRRAIYAIACEYDLLILEDDPYYFLHFKDVGIRIIINNF